eukprot:CAMPEP_0184704192 /NCGR_PEP_ID=MMETSP0313-20130426/30392_1 /TAXON_ID=2792 /ORGANISM="Porphyridium aerugineum, Strain SAG 1380-2" /LENGTH=378 /DNA_ID=CAMNT_0027165165 /DNA_START=63 /DNA_END=1199 /DNA_ORIENTATION=-
MDPLAKQEALIKQSQGENYVGKRQAMVAARLQARGLKGRAYYDSADHSMQQQKEQQQQAEKEKLAQEQEEHGIEEEEDVENKDAQDIHHHEDDKGSVNKFASESGSIGKKASGPTHGSLGGRSTSKGAESGSLDEARSHLQSSGGNPVAYVGGEVVAPPVIKAPTLPASVEKKVGTTGIGVTSLRAAVQPPPQSASTTHQHPQPQIRPVSEPAKPVIKLQAHAPAPITEPPAVASVDSVSSDVSEQEAVQGGPRTSIKTTGIRLKSGTAQVRQSAPSPAPQVGVKVAAGGPRAPGGEMAPGAVPVVGRKLGTSSTTGIRSVNLAASVRPASAGPPGVGGALPKAYELNREQVIHKVPTGVSPLMKQVTAKAVEEDDEE